MLNKKDHICYCLATACIELMSQDNVEYEGKTKDLKEEFLRILSMTKMYYHRSIDKGTYNWYKKVISAFDSEVPVGTKWIPLLLANEVMGAWLTDNSKHLKFWSKWDFSEIYDHLDGIPEDTEKNMYDVAGKVIEKVTGKKRNEQKIKNILKLKHIKTKLSLTPKANML